MTLTLGPFRFASVRCFALVDDEEGVRTVCDDVGDATIFLNENGVVVVVVVVDGGGGCDVGVDTVGVDGNERWVWSIDDGDDKKFSSTDAEVI